LGGALGLAPLSSDALVAAKNPRSVNAAVIAI
jgi:hypothetical protein